MVDVDAHMTPMTVGKRIEFDKTASPLSASRLFLQASLYFLVALLPLTIAWSLTNPMFASPDEQVHLIRSQGAVRGDLASPYITDGISGDVCFAMDPTITADCQNLTWDASRITAADNADGYPPLFHFVAGIPNLFVSGLGGAYLTRIWLACICASLLALAAGLLWAWRPSPWTSTGFLLGCTPMVIFLIATVNPSGLTTALAGVIWASGIVIVAPSASPPIPAVYPMFLISREPLSHAQTRCALLRDGDLHRALGSHSPDRLASTRSSTLASGRCCLRDNLRKLDISTLVEFGRKFVRRTGRTPTAMRDCSPDWVICSIIS